jgi:hypothetical protein
VVNATQISPIVHSIAIPRTTLFLKVRLRSKKRVSALTGFRD